jgi:hypothetical protein
MQWNEWQHQEIWWNEQEVLPRTSCIRRFVRDGLYPFLHQKGYRFKRSLEAITNDIANGLFENRLKSCLESDWAYPSVNTDFVEDDKWHWGDVLSEEEWATFWNIWGRWEDVNLDSFRGQDRRIDIETYCWTQLDLDASPASEFVNELYNFNQAESDAPQAPSAPWKKAREDTYLREAAESGEWGGYRR